MKFEEWWEIFETNTSSTLSNKEVALATWIGAISHNAKLDNVCCVNLLGYSDGAKINAIKVVRTAFCDIGLRDAKNLVEAIPTTISNRTKRELRNLASEWNKMFSGGAVFVDGLCIKGECDSCIDRFSCYTER